MRSSINGDFITVGDVLLWLQRSARSCHFLFLLMDDV